MSDARIYEQGYRSYDGPRLGVAASVRSLAIHSIRRGLGLRRTFWAKLLPIAYCVAGVLLVIGVILWALTRIFYKPEGGHFQDIEHMDLNPEDDK